MKTLQLITKGINIIALLFLALGAYGIAITGALQVLAAILFLSINFKNRFIYIYFGLVFLFFIF